MKKNNTKLGDIFCVTWNTSSKKYLQYVVSDLTQLNSDVIRIFKKTYSTEDHPSVDEIVIDEVDFYAHCITKRGVELNLWQVVGNTNKVGTTRILFRDSNDYGDPEIVISENWVVWEVNEEQRYVGKLLGENRKADIGIVFPPHLIIERIKNGCYDFVYPSFD